MMPPNGVPTSWWVHGVGGEAVGKDIGPAVPPQSRNTSGSGELPSWLSASPGAGVSSATTPGEPPMSAFLLAAMLSTQPEPYRIDLLTITVDDARTLNGKRVRVSFTTGCPSYSIDGLTVTGPGEQPADGDEVSRGVVLRGETIIDPGERVAG